VTRLENLLLILTLQSHPVIDFLVLHMNLFNWFELAHWVNILLHNRLLLLLLLLVTTTKKIWHVLNIIWANVSDL